MINKVSRIAHARKDTLIRSTGANTREAKKERQAAKRVIRKQSL